MKEGREIFRIEHRKTREGAFWGGAIDTDWQVYQMPSPSVDPEKRIIHFVDDYPDTAIFAFLSLESIISWFELTELRELDAMDFHVSVFLVNEHYGVSVFSQEQVVFVRNHVEWIRFISLLDL